MHKGTAESVTTKGPARPESTMTTRFFDRRLAGEAARYRCPLALTIALSLAGGVLLVAQARLLSLSIVRPFLEGAQLAAIRPLLLGLAAVAVLRAVTAWGAETAAAELSTRARADLRERLYAHLMQLGPAYAKDERSGDLAHMVTEGVDALDPYLSQYLPQIAVSALVPAAVLIFVLGVDPLSGIVLLLTAPLIPLFMVLIGGVADSLTRRQWTELSRLSAHFLDVLQGLPTLKLFNRSRGQARIIAEISERHRAATMDVLRVAFLSALVLELLATIGTAVVAVEIGLRLLYGRLTFEQALFVLILTPDFYFPLRQLAARFHAGVSGSAAADRIFATLDTAPEPSPANPAPPAQGGAPEVEFADVTVSFDAASNPALRDLKLKMPTGETLALVGPTGAGKTSVAQLLLRFIAPTAGAIQVDGEALQNIPADAWRARIAWAPQRPHLFNRSAAENIRLGRPDAADADVQAAARAAGADAFIAQLPLGYDTPLGERAARLSGGQAQRIALARAFLRDAPLVILDEPTANLDPTTEAQIQTAIERLLQDRTALLIAHRLNTIPRSARVAVLESGRVVETGALATLTTAGGPFARLAAQADCTLPPLTGEPNDVIPFVVAASASSFVVTASAVGVGRTTAEAVTTKKSDAQVSDSPLRFLLHALKPVAGWIALSVLLGFGAIGAGVGLLAASAWLISMAALQPSIAVLQVSIVSVRFFGISRAALRYAERLASHQATFRVLSGLRSKFYDAVEPLAPAGLARFHSADLMARAVSDINALENFYIRAVAPPLVALLVIGATGLWLTRYGLPVALCAVLFLALTALIGSLTSWGLARGAGRDLATVRAKLYVELVDSVQGMADLLAFNHEAAQFERVRASSRELAHLHDRFARVAALNAALTALMPALTAIGLLIVTVPRVSAGALSGVSLAVIVLGTLAAFEAVWPLSAAAQYLESSLASARRLLEIAPPPIASTEQAKTNVPPIEQPNLPPDIRFADVRFSYDPARPPALDGVTFDAPAGAHIAIVGPSGAGKSTLVNLLARFWDPDAGRITVNGHDLRDTDPDAARRMIGVLSQDTHLFNATLRDNVRVARPDASPDELEAVIRMARLDEYVRTLPDGDQTWIGEQGLRLSGGERQRLAIARVLLKNAPILILDEPTSGLDAVTERDLWASIRPVIAGRTVLLITHRLALARDADRVLVMLGGRIVQQGTHADLIARPGPYRSLWESQCLALP